MTDPIADLFTRIRNGASARHSNTTVPYSRLKEAISKILKNKKYIEDYSVSKEDAKAGSSKGEARPELVLFFNEATPKMTFKRVSKPGQRIYRKTEEIRKVNNGFGISIVSTPQGLMTGSEARKKKLGGEVICEVY